MFGWLKKLTGAGGGESSSGPQRGLPELARRLGVSVPELQKVPIQYNVFRIPKRTGGVRLISAPCPELKGIQKRILRRLLTRLNAHPCAMGFERGRSILTNASPHAGRDIIIRMDIQEFFPSIKSARVERFFRAIGWDKESARSLTRICTNEDALPQGAPTSPRLSNLVNIRLDARLAELARKLGIGYTRYADDLTFSLTSTPGPDAVRPGSIVHIVKAILQDEGYNIHLHKKLRISRRHQRQVVTGLVVNDRPNLPRARRRWLRAVEHHVQTGRPATLTSQQLAGWQALRQMIEADGST